MGDKTHGREASESRLTFAVLLIREIMWARKLRACHMMPSDGYYLDSRYVKSKHKTTCPSF